MKKFSKSAFIAALALVSYAGFAAAQGVSFDNSSDSNDVSALVNDLKGPGFGGPGGHGGPGGGNHGGFNPGGGGDHGGFHPGGGGDHGPWHPQPTPQPQPQPWHPQPQPGPWHPQPGPQPGPWFPHHPGHPDWDHNDWHGNYWNHHDPQFNDWWNNYDAWWVIQSNHPYSMYRTTCAVVPGVSAKGYIIEQTQPFNGKATFYYYNSFGTIIGSSNSADGVYRGGDGTPIFDFYQVPQADHCFLAITQ